MAPVRSCSLQGRTGQLELMGQTYRAAKHVCKCSPSRLGITEVDDGMKSEKPLISPRCSGVQRSQDL